MRNECARYPSALHSCHIFDGVSKKQLAEIIVCPVVETYERYKVMDFSAEVIFTDYIIIYPRPKIQANFMGFIMPFSASSWSVICAAFLLMSSLSYIIWNLSPIGKLDREDANWVRTNSFNLTPMWVFRGVVGQINTTKTNGIGGRLLMTFWLLLMLNLYVVYKCNLKALLIVPKVDVPFNDLDGLVRQHNFKWTFLDGSIITLYFKPAFEDDPHSVFGLGWRDRGHLYTNVDKLPSYVLDKKMAAFEQYTNVIHIVSEDFSKTGICRYAIAEGAILDAKIGYSFKKGSAMPKLMNPIILRLREAGILGKIFFQKAANSSYCNVPPGREQGPKLRALEMMDCIGMFSILWAGWIISVIVFLVELSMKERNKPKKILF